MSLSGRILIVDDSNENRDAIARLLRKEGYDVKDTPDAAIALEIADVYSPDIFLIEVKMPGINGLVLLEKIDLNNRNAEVIMMTGYENVDDIRQAMHLGAHSYIRKPIRRDELLDHISSAFNRINKRTKQTRQQQVLEKEVNSRTAELLKTLQIAEYQSRKLDLILNNMTEPLIAIDMEKIIITLNQAAEEQFTVNAVECLGKNIADVILVRRLIEIIDSFTQQYHSGNLIAATTFSIKCKEKFYTLTVNIMKNLSAEPCGLILIFNDQTEQHRAAQLRSGFLTLVAHEFRTPLSALYNGYSILREGYREPLVFEDALDIIDLSVIRLSDLVNTVVKFANVQRPNVLPEEHAFSIKELISTCIRKFAVTAQTRNIHLNHDFTSPVDDVIADEQLLKDSLECVIDNAIKISPSESTVSIKVEVEVTSSVGGYLVLHIQDHGPGITEEKASRIFEWFWQGEDHLTRSCTGLGIGLPLALRAVEIMGGTLKHSTPQQGGCCFTISVPVKVNRMQSE